MTKCVNCRNCDLKKFIVKFRFFHFINKIRKPKSKILFESSENISSSDELIISLFSSLVSYFCCAAYSIGSGECLLNTILNDLYCADLFPYFFVVVRKRVSIFVSYILCVLMLYQSQTAICTYKWITHKYKKAANKKYVDLLFQCVSCVYELKKNVQRNRRKTILKTMKHTNLIGNKEARQQSSARQLHKHGKVHAFDIPNRTSTWDVEADKNSLNNNYYCWHCVFCENFVSEIQHRLCFAVCFCALSYAAFFASQNVFVVGFFSRLYLFILFVWYCFLFVLFCFRCCNVVSVAAVDIVRVVTSFYYYYVSTYTLHNLLVTDFFHFHFYFYCYRLWTLY